ncbi:MAG: hypothetical protein WB791_02910 [Waddliaceae bacterium]
MKNILSLICFMFFNSLAFSEITVVVPDDLVLMSGCSLPEAINHHGEVLFKYLEEGSCSYHYAIWSSKGGIEPVNDDKHLWIGINNTKTLFSDNSRLAIWSNHLGTQKIDTKRLGYNTKNHRIVGINSPGQIIGNYETKNNIHKGFICEKGEAEEFILNDAEDLGFHIVGIKLIDINENGSILGMLEYGERHPLKNLFYITGRKYFLWDGSTHVIEGADSSLDTTIKLNNMDEVAFTAFEMEKVDGEEREVSNTFKWSRDGDVKNISDNFSLTGFDDKGQISGCEHLGVNSFRCLINHKGEHINLDAEIKKINPDIELINNPILSSSGVILYWIRMWGENQFVLIYVE